MSLVFACPVFGQSIQTEPLAKQQQGDATNRQQEKKIGNEGSNESSQKEKADESFPITIYGPQQKLEIDPADPPAALVAQSWGGIYRGDDKPEIPPWDIVGQLQMYSRSGRILWTIPCRTIANKGAGTIVVDAKRQRIYVGEELNYSLKISSQISAFDYSGNRLWTVDLQNFKFWTTCNSLKVDPKTGNLWVSRGKSETLVFDSQGKMIKSIPVESLAMAYDHKTGSFWLYASDLFRFSSDFKMLSRSKSDGYVEASEFYSILIDDDGTVWTSKDPLQGPIKIRRYSSTGNLLREIKFLLHSLGNGWRIKPWGEGKLILFNHYRFKSDLIFDKKTESFSRYAAGMHLVEKSKSAIWCISEEGVSATDFNSKEIFSQKPLTVEDWKKEMKMRQEQLNLLSKELAQTDPSLKRARKVIADWSEFIEGYGDAEKEAEEFFRGFSLHIIRN